MVKQELTSQDDNQAEKPTDKSTVLVLVRHGNTATTGKILPGRSPGLNLSPDGIRQAEEVAEQLATVANIAAIYSSPLERAQQTASPLGKHLGMKI